MADPYDKPGPWLSWDDVTVMDGPLFPLAKPDELDWIAGLTADETRSLLAIGHRREDDEP